MKTKSIVVTIVAVFVVLGSMAGLGMAAYMNKFYGAIEAPSFPEPEDETAARLQDLEYLAQYPSLDLSFSAEEKVQFDAHVEELRSNVESLSDQAFWSEIAAAAAISENGHTNVARHNLLNRYNRLPLRVYWFEEGLFVVRAQSDYAHLIGSRIISIDGNRPEDMLSALDRYFGGNEHFLRAESPPYLTSPEFLHTIAVASSPASLELVLEDQEGEVVTVDISASNEPTTIAGASDLPLGMPLEAEQEGAAIWQHLDVEKTSQTPFGASPGERFFASNLPANGKLIRLRYISGEYSDGTALDDWLGAQAQALRSSPVDYLVVDLRHNNGGNLMLARPFSLDVLDYLTPDGKLYILIDGGTFSAGIVTVAYLKSAAGDRGLIVGSPLGDFDEFWAEGTWITLPNSGIHLAATTGRHNWVDGCEDFDRCYWLSVIFGVAVGSLEPELESSMSFTDYAQGVDTVMEAVFRHQGIDRAAQGQVAD